MEIKEGIHHLFAHPLCCVIFYRIIPDKVYFLNNLLDLNPEVDFTLVEKQNRGKHSSSGKQKSLSCQPTLFLLKCRCCGRILPVYHLNALKSINLRRL
jgi:hypothetical protein